MAPGGVRHPARSSRGPASSPPPRPRPGPTAAPAGRRRPPRSSGRWTCSRPRSAWTRPRCAGATSSRRTRSRSRPRAASTYDSGEYAKALDRVLEAAATRSCGPSRPPAGSAATPSSSASASRCSSRSPAAARSPRTPRSRCTRTARSPCSPAPRRTARATPRPGRCWPASTSASRSRRSPSSTATPTSIPRGARHDGLAQPADRRGRGATRPPVELVELARQRAADVLEAAVDDLEVADGAVRVRGTDVRGHARPSWPSRSRCGWTARFDSGAPSFPFGAHLAVVEVDVESGKAVVDRIVTVDDAGPGAQPAARARASGTAGSPRASPRRCSRRSSTTPTATR